MAISNSKQDWSVGKTVKVGFMTLKIVGIRAEKDSLPDIYELVNEKNGNKYEFIPHNGLVAMW